MHLLHIHKPLWDVLKASGYVANCWVKKDLQRGKSRKRRYYLRMYELYLAVQYVFLLFLVQCTFRIKFRKHNTDFHVLVRMLTFIHEDWPYMQNKLLIFHVRIPFCVWKGMFMRDHVYAVIGHENHQWFGCIQAIPRGKLHRNPLGNSWWFCQQRLRSLIFKVL